MAAIDVCAAAASAAGFSGTNLVTAVAVAGAESSWNPDATHTNSNGSTDYGLWQINSIHAAILAAGTWSNPTHNAIMAYKVWSQAGQRWTPWAAYNSGSYQQYLDDAAAAVANLGVDTPDTGHETTYVAAAGKFLEVPAQSAGGQLEATVVVFSGHGYGGYGA